MTNNSRFIQPFGSFNTSFNPLPTINTNGDPKSMFSNNNFVNNNNLLYNNLSENLLNIDIREYSVLIDSKDRNYQVYPNPFIYDVRFKPLAASRITKNGKTTILEDPNPTIYDNFTNVKYIKLETVILPFFTHILPDKTKQLIDTSRALTDELYTVLSIGDYCETNYKSTNDVLSGSFSTIYYEARVSDTHYRGLTINSIKYFPQDELGKIDKLSIRFTDPYGQPLNVKHLNRHIKSNMTCECNSSHEDPLCFKHNLYHPLNPMFQHHLHFKVGVVQPRLNKLTFH